MNQALYLVEVLLEAVAQRHLERVAQAHPGLTQKQLQAIGDADPTGGGAVDWIARQLSWNEIELPKDVEKVRRVLDTFARLRDNPAFRRPKNLYDYRSFDALLQAAEQAVMPRAMAREAARREGAKLVRRHGDLALYQITTYEAAKAMCAATDVCLRHPGHYARHSEKGPVYIISKDDVPYLFLAPVDHQLKDVNNHNPSDAEVREAMPLIKDIVRKHAEMMKWRAIGQANQGIHSAADVDALMQGMPEKRKQNVEMAVRGAQNHYQREYGVPMPAEEVQFLRNSAVNFEEYARTRTISDAYGLAMRLSFEP